MPKKIRSVSQYLNWVSHHRCSEGDLSFAQSNVYYRGQASIAWKITPSLFREPQIFEYNAIRAATLRLWNSVSKYSSLERLIYFQHYGLRTRLLDITRNPLVALYIASLKSGDNNDGIVYYGYCNNDYSLRNAEIIADIVSNYDIESSGIVSSEWIEMQRRKYTPHIGNINDFVNILCSPQFIDAPFNSDRIIHQQVAFLISPILSIHDQNENLYKRINTYDFQIGENGFFGQDTSVIPATAKPSILKELNYLNINEASLFTCVENVLQTINNQSTLNF